MKNKKTLNKNISTEIGVGIILLIAIVIGGLTYSRSKNEANTNLSINGNLNSANNSNTYSNKYSNDEYGFSLNLPYSLDKYVMTISPNTIAKISFWLPATNKLFMQYTGHKLTDAFSILIYPKNEIDTIRKSCSASNQRYIKYECILIDEQPLAENNMYSFYYLKGGINMGAYPQPLDDQEYTNSEKAAKSLRAQTWTLNYDSSASHVYTDNNYGFTMDYPANWRASGQPSPSIYKQDLVNVFSVGGTMKDGTYGELFFGKYDIYNNKLSDSVDKNVEFLNSEVNIIGSKSTFREVKIQGGRIFYNTIQDSPLPNERNVFIVGKNVIFNGSIQTSSKNMNNQELDEFALLLSNFRFK